MKTKTERLAVHAAIGFFLIILVSLCSCESKPKIKHNTIVWGSDMSANGDMLNDAVHDSLKKNSFEGAYAILDNAKENVYNSTIADLRMEVCKAEITYLVDQNTDATWEKAFFLVKTSTWDEYYNPDPFKKKIELCELLSDYAISYGHAETAIQLVQYMDALLQKMVDLSEKEDRYDREKWQEPLIGARAIIHNCSKLVTAEAIMQDRVVFDIEDEDMLAKLASLNDEAASNKILYQVGLAESNIPPKPEIGMVKSNSRIGGVESYNEQATKCNSICKKVMSAAIISRNKYLAEHVLTYLRPNVSVVDRGEVKKGYDILYYYIKTKEDSSMMNDVLSMYRSAVARGVFE